MMTTKLTVREARIDDSEPLGVLLGELFLHQHSGRPELFREPLLGEGSERARLGEFVRGLLGKCDEVVLVAHDDTALLGLVQVRLRRVEASPSVPFRQPTREAWIQHIVVADAARGLGVGRLLDRAARVWAVEQGARSIGLQVWEFNAGALAFFERLGYLPRSVQLYVENLGPDGENGANDPG